MKRRDRKKHLKAHGCEFDRSGSKHDVWWNPIKNKRTTIMRHREIQPTMARLICKQLGVPLPRQK